MIKKERPHFNIIFIGNVDAGKSTTAGHLLYKLGCFEKSYLKKVKQEAEEMGCGSMYLALALDKIKSEHEGCIIIENKFWKFETINNNFTLIDSVGHREFIGKMIAGISLANVAVLILSALPGDFEWSISDTGSVKEHIFASQSSGIEHFIVCINQMDAKSVKYSKQRYEEIVNKIKSIFEGYAINTESINFIPISGYVGDNLTEKSDKMNWYSGPTLLEALDGLTQQNKYHEKPLRFSVQDSFLIQGVGSIIQGKVETGILKQGQDIVIMPNNLKSTVETIEIDGITISQAIAGQKVSFKLKSSLEENMRRGSLIGDVQTDYPRTVLFFTAKMIIVAKTIEIKPDLVWTINCSGASVPCKVEVLESEKPRKIEESENLEGKIGDIFVFKFIPLLPFCIERFSDYSPVGRISCQDKEVKLGVGIVLDVKKNNEILTL